MTAQTPSRDDDDVVVPPHGEVIVEPPDGGGRGWASLTALIAILALIGAAVLIDLWLQDDDPEGVGVGVTLNEVTSDPAEFSGETVIVSGEVSEVVSPNAFTLEGGDEFYFGGEDLLVVSVRPFPVINGRDDQLLENDLAQVRGTVVHFVLTDVEEDFDLDLDDDLYVDYEDRPAVIAEQVDVGARAPRGDVDEDGNAVILNPGDIAEDVESYIGQGAIDVRGAVGEVLSSSAFRFEDNLLVVGGDTFEGIEEGTLALATGEVVTFNIADVESELGVDLDDELFADYEGDVPIVADLAGVAADLDDIRDEPEAFVGTSVTVAGRSAQSVSTRLPSLSVKTWWS